MGGERWKWHSLGLALALSASAFKICLFYQVGYINVFSLSLSLSLFFSNFVAFLFIRYSLSLFSPLSSSISLSFSCAENFFPVEDVIVAFVRQVGGALTPKRKQGEKQDIKKEKKKR